MSSPRLPSPRASLDWKTRLLQHEEVNEPITFKDFAFFLQAKKLKEAAMSLSVLLDLSDEKSLKATHHFLIQLQAQPGFFMRLMTLRDEIARNDQNSALMTLMTCFGIDHVDAVVGLNAVMQSMKGPTGSP